MMEAMKQLNGSRTRESSPGLFGPGQAAVYVTYYKQGRNMLIASRKLSPRIPTIESHRERAVANTFNAIVSESLGDFTIIALWEKGRASRRLEDGFPTLRKSLRGVAPPVADLRCRDTRKIYDFGRPLAGNYSLS
jgi:hypothetical protein